jgi:pimeloyl-ACP methyl ester carboxylesterase
MAPKYNLEEAPMTTKDTNVSRRHVLGSTALGLGLSAVGTQTVQAQSANPSAKTFVLVHGSWHGGWCWRRVADRLEAKGHKVYAPTLTGVGERSHLLNASINLDTHIADVVNVIKWENLSNIVLVGHSYAGFVISGVAEKVAPGTIGSAVFLDAFVPASGESLVSIATPAIREQLQALAAKGEVAAKPAPAAFFKLNAKDEPWVNEQCTPHPLGSMTQPITVTGARERIAKKSYIRTTIYNSPAFAKVYAQLKDDKAWRMYEIESGHDAMLDAPDRLTEILLEVA